MSDLVYFSFSQLFKHGVHLGLQSTLLHSSMLKYLLPVNYLNFTLFNLNFAYVSLRLVSNFIITMASMRKPSLVINSVSFLDDFLVDFFVGLNQPVARGLWVSGRLTNFRFVRQSSVRRFYLHKIIIKAFARIESMGLSNSSIRNIMNRTFNPIHYKQSVFRHVMNLTRMPRFCFINDSVINAVSVNECFILNIPSVCSVDSGSSNISYVTYPIPGNSVSLASVLLYYSIHKYSVQRGIYKERYLFILNSLKAKLRLNALLKRPLSVQSFTFKSRLPFIKVKVKLDTLTNSIKHLITSYKLSEVYQYFFTKKLVNFQKLSKKYLLTLRSFNLYTHYLSSGNFNYNSLFDSLNNKLYNFLLLPASSNDINQVNRFLNFLKLGDLAVASLFSDITNKLKLTQFNSNYYPVFNSFVGEKFIMHFLKNFNQYAGVLKSINNFKFKLFNFLYYNNKLIKDIKLVLATADVFSTNFTTIYRKLFLFQKNIILTYSTKLFSKIIVKSDYRFSSYIIPVNILLLWLSLPKKVSKKMLVLGQYLTPCYLPIHSKVKTNVSNFLKVHLVLSSSYSLFYKSISLNYRQVRPFIISFFRLWINNKQRPFFYKQPIYKRRNFVYKRSRRW